MVLIKGNKRTFRRPLEKVTITTCDTSQTTMDGERYSYIYIVYTRDRQTHKNIQTYKNNHANKKKKKISHSLLNIIR
jgi:hypothetical protein